MSLDVQQALAALGEPSRFRIVELLGERAMTVGEVTEALGALQPQTTKHIQALEAAGVIKVHKLGRRRVARLDRDSLGELVSYFGQLARAEDDDAALESYDRAIVAEGEHRTGARTLEFERQLETSPEAVWAAWTDPERAARWWAPRHFSVDTFEIAPEVGAPIQVALREGTSDTYTSIGQVVEADPGRRLVFSLAPVDSQGQALFSAIHTVTVAGDNPTTLRLMINISDVRDDAAAAVAGMDAGWPQLLDQLQAMLAG